jgi:hypothetical protein
MFFFTFLIIAAVLFLLARSGRIGPPPWARGGGNRLTPFSPEYEARKTLAHRFANGEMDSDEFIERAAALNWTPGVDPRPEQVKARKRKS